MREKLPQLALDRFIRLEGRGMRDPSRLAVMDFLNGHAKGQHILVAAATDTSALGVLEAARRTGREADFAIVGQDCIPEVLEEMHSGKSAVVGSVSHEAASYGPRLIQLGIAPLRGNTVPPYNYVRHRVVTPQSVASEEAADSQSQPALGTC